MEAFLRYAGEVWERRFNYASSSGIGLASIVAVVLVWDDPGSASFVLTASARPS